MRRACWLFALVLGTVAAGRPDTITQISAEGKLLIIQRDAILVKEDSALLVYKHFDLKERRVVKVTLNKGSLPYRVEIAKPEERHQIVETWKRFGHTATVTDDTGKTLRVFDVYLDFYPPGGRGSLLESVPPRTNFPLLLSGGAADEVEFSKIDRVEIFGSEVKLILRSGESEQGRFLMPTDRPAETRLLGITDRYDPASEQVFDFFLSFARVKQIRFEP